MKKSFLLNVLLSAIMLLVVSCGEDDAPAVDKTVNAEISSFRIVSPVEASGTINNTDKTIVIEVPGDVDVTTAEVAIEVPEGATVSPASGTEVDFTSPVEFTVTGSDAEGNPITEVYTVSVEKTAVVAFVGSAPTIEELEDDAQAAATWMQATYGDEFVYLSADEITPDAVSNLKVIFYYKLEATAPVDLGAMASEEVASTISNYVRDGGQLLLAGDAAQYIFNIDRVPEAYAFNEVNEEIGVEENKAADDFWGLSAVPTTTSADRTAHPLFEGLLNAENRLYLNNAPTREVRLVWWNVGPAGGACCGEVEMITNFEEQLKAVKLASLQHVTDYFGFAAVEFGRTDLDTHANFSADVPKDFRGTVLMLANSIIGYEWETNDGSVNEYEENIELLTANAIEYLRAQYDAQ
ncbi:DUF4960 domain-containing protein [Nafulsella turpanensis]|uniref:DUF4960 domain-containing protein n=1 Tax=Nafulsella turpanensis TaxID=1265690 RepID=UPI001F3F6543|nr:DUF4960 domain-containing protein [Nafulsella turpanensis]